MVKNKAVYVALALNPDGEKEVLGLWIEQTEGAKFWLKVINHQKTRGVNDILMAVVDVAQGLSGGDRLGPSADRGADLHREVVEKVCGRRFTDPVGSL
ncbi:hypothetical protein LMTR3_21680 [Bradyrhizobium sp. LMTR 3]|nr:hypothetical protein LMTR3_21680 [Bradyrhizobium sp. LMTR 3]